MILSLCEIAALRPPADICAHITDTFTIQTDMKHCNFHFKFPPKVFLSPLRKDADSHSHPGVADSDGAFGQ